MGAYMGSLSVIPFIGILGILFIVFNIFLFVLVVLTIIFGVIRFKKKKFKKIFLVLLAITVLAGIKDYQIVNEFVNYDEIKHQNLIKEEGKELVAIRDNDYNKVEQYLKSGWDPNENTKSVYYSIKYNTESNKKKDEWKILELLLKHGANPDVQIFENPTGVNTPLTYTTECGYYGATKLLLEYGADCNFQEDYMKQNSLLALRFYENDAAAKTLQLLLDYGTDLDIKQSDNKSGREELKNFQKDYMNVKDIAEAMEMEYSGTARVIRNLIKKGVIGQLEVGKYDNQTTHKIYVVNPYIYINGQNPDEDTLKVFFDNTGWKEFMADVD